MVVDDKSDGCASVLIAGEFLEWMQGSHQVGFPFLPSLFVWNVRTLQTQVRSFLLQNTPLLRGSIAFIPCITLRFLRTC